MPNNTLVPTRKGEAPLRAAQRGRQASQFRPFSAEGVLGAFYTVIAMRTRGHPGTRREGAQRA